MHEIQDHERGFDDCDREGDHRIQWTGKVIERHPCGHSGAHQEREKNHDVNAWINYVLAHKSEISDQRSAISKTNPQSEFRNPQSPQVSGQMATQQIKQRKQENPNDVHEVPIET